MRETGSLLTHQVDAKTSQIWKYFYLSWWKNVPGPLNSVDDCNFSNVLYLNIFHSVPVQPELLWLYEIFSPHMVHIWLAYGSLRWTVLIIWDFQFIYGSLIVHIGKMVGSGEANQFIYDSKFYLWRGLLCCRAKWRNGLIFGTVWKLTNFFHIIGPLVFRS